MEAHSALKAFERLLADAGLELENSTAAQVLPIYIEFYRDQRADDCPEDSDGDMLLYQWGAYGDSFVFDLTRQFIFGGDSEDENIWQLSLSFSFPATEGLRAIESGNKWCQSPRSRGVDYFEGFIRESAAYQAVADVKPAKVSLDYDCAG